MPDAILPLAVRDSLHIQNLLGNRPTSGSGEVACLGFCCGRVREQASQISESVVLEGTLVVLEVQKALDFLVVQCPHCIKI